MLIGIAQRQRDVIDSEYPTGNSDDERRIDPSLGLAIAVPQTEEAIVHVDRAGKDFVERGKELDDRLDVGCRDSQPPSELGMRWRLHEHAAFPELIGQFRCAGAEIRQHPVAGRTCDLEAATLLYQRAAWLYDQDKPCGAEANAAKFFCAEAGFRACETAVLTLGGMGYAKEYHVERYLRESMLPRIVPISQQLILCFIAEKVLGLPKSY